MQARLALLSLSLLFSAFLQVHAANFTFNYGAATQCDDFSVSWSGGTPPFSLTLAPEYGSPRTIKVPTSSFSGGQGSFSVTLAFPSNNTFVAIMSDAAGFASGGVSKVITTGPPVGNTQCDITGPKVDFFFDLNDALAQCRAYSISGYDQAVQPVQIIAVVPGGDAIILNPPTGPTSYEWTADAAAGTSLMFIMYDSQGRNGGSSDVRTVSQSDDKSCLSANSPASATNAPQATQSSSPSSSPSSGVPISSSTSSPADHAPADSKSNTGAIVGGVLAGLFGLFTLTALGIFFWRRHQRTKTENYYNGGFAGRGSRRKGRLNSMDLDPPVGLNANVTPLPVVQPFPYTASHVSEPFSSPSSHDLLTSRSSHYPLDNQTQYSSFTNPFNEPPPPSEYSSHSRNPSMPGMTASGSSVHEHARMGSMSSSGRSKASMAGAIANRPTRFILHTDIEEVTPEDENEEVVELPPQYSERRAPLPSVRDGLEAGSTAPSLHPLEHRRGGSDVGLQPPIQPGPLTPPPGSTFNHS